MDGQTASQMNITDHLDPMLLIWVKKKQINKMTSKRVHAVSKDVKCEVFKNTIMQGLSIHTQKETQTGCLHTLSVSSTFP